REQRRIELLLVGGTAQYFRTRQRCANVDGQFERRPDRVRERTDDCASRAVSDWLLREGFRRPDPRSESRVERPGVVGCKWGPCALADRGWQGNAPSRSPLPAAPRSAGEIDGHGK